MSEPATLPEWLDNLGYSAEASSLHRSVDDVPRLHPYARELSALLDPAGAIRAQAVFAVDGTPTVVFVGQSGNPLSKMEIDGIRKRIWNQNLASIVVEIRGKSALAFPASKLDSDADQISLGLDEARPDGPLSARDVKGADLATRQPEWFKLASRVDHRLIHNISVVIRELTEKGFDSSRTKEALQFGAQLLMGQILFVSYLEHRGIVGATYRERRQVEPLHGLIAQADRTGIANLVDRLQEDFNGDFLSQDRHVFWKELNSTGFDALNEFLKRTEMSSGQGHFWNYDFSFIPVELLSSLYESFLVQKEKKTEGAFYTPRHLAVLAVDQALAACPDPCAATIFDGACGSGILLTTALRRLILAHEDRLGRPINLAERRDILTRQIFGGDTNRMAGRVTAFSLYLSVLEDLTPKDILDAQQAHDARLPSLANQNLICRPAGNYFSRRHPFSGRRFDILISNPPWVEPKGGKATQADFWAESRNYKIVRRQMAAAFSLRARDFVKAGGIVCLILPIPLLLGETSRSFIATILRLLRPLHIINFGDLQQLLFPTAENTCHVFVGEARDSGERPKTTETFAYSVPKADLSLSMGRLSLQSSDRHRLLTNEVMADNGILTNYMWGDANDVALMARLGSYGRIEDMLGTRADGQPGWVSRKGIHLVDASRKPVSARPLFTYPFYTTVQLNGDAPVRADEQPGLWPRQHDQVVGLDDGILSIFDGPRVLFADGFDKDDLTPRAVFLEGKGAFTSSVGVISGPQKDADLLRFLAVYLRSTLVRYFMMLTNAKMLTERNGIHLADLNQFPFFRPEEAPDRIAANSALKAVADEVKRLEQLPDGRRADAYQESYDRLDDLVFKYFGLGDHEQTAVHETVNVLMPAIRPRSMSRLREIARDRVGTDGIKVYSEALLGALSSWRDASGGTGRFHVSSFCTNPIEPGAVGVAKIEYDSNADAVDTAGAKVDADLVRTLLAQIQQSEVLGPRETEGINFMPTLEIWFDGKFYVARPLQRRNWTVRMALRDADRLVEAVRQRRATTEMQQ
ncbi:MAG: DNA methylase [Mesorhizobium sp.]|uniref:Eco57I restriction-modification methylase domain-containing protein n=1 Tax=unclassified Mesorhizobium TaxID=325217 RepID=UPI000FD2A1B7|nr:N-6 DNA methylase [Mesorhizobium sp. M1A.F.Ca.ET.072.01.1.1]RUW53762.1 DNA methylase [Mesorhizobium sp. M1A.F.Ca.ET.072.01.1.1]RWB54338.1 MAG: DNA methylase [Mesorhizobium sp.]TIV03714.1 MAG: DNA methylase [Mesorhizobium sp.]